MPGDAGTPYLTVLDVAPASNPAAGRSLVPAFSPDIHDYYVRCAGRVNDLRVVMTASPGSTASLLRPTTSSPAPSQTLSAKVEESAAIVVVAARGKETSEYWVRCLPHDFPQIRVVRHPDAGVPPLGYYLLGDIAPTRGGSFAMAIDIHGVPVWYDLTVNGGGAIDVDFVFPDMISFAPLMAKTFASTSGSFELHSLTSTETSYVNSVGEPLDMHECQHLANGHFLVLTAPISTGVDLTGLGSYGPGSNLINCNVQEIDAKGSVVWRWAATDHFDAVKDSTHPRTYIVEGKPAVDAFHCNAIDVNGDGDLLISARFMDSLFLVSHVTGRVVWKIGGATYSKDGASYMNVINDPVGGFFRQHDARFLPNGRISVFDDETERADPARAIVLAYDVKAGTATVEWQYAGAMNSAAMGSFRILGDGSRVIGWGVGAAGGLAFTEVTEGGADVLDGYFDDGNASYRALKVPASELDLETLRNDVHPAAHRASGSRDAGADASGADSATVSSEGGPSRDAAPPVGCHVTSSMSNECSYRSTCSVDAGSVPGSCPAAGLFGCCVEMRTVDGGADALAATCYYSADAGQPASSQCDLEAYQGMPYVWQTYPP